MRSESEKILYKKRGWMDGGGTKKRGKKGEGKGEKEKKKKEEGDYKKLGALK